MNFLDNTCIEFENKFGGIFTQLIPGSTDVYIDSEDVIHKLDKNTVELVEKSLADGINYLLENDIIQLNVNDFY